MKFCVLGAGGRQGQSTTMDLLRSGNVTSVLACDLEEEYLQKLSARVGQDPRLGTLAFDINDRERLEDALRGVTVCINATPYYRNLDVMKACLSAGCNYVDLGGLFHMTRKQLSLDDDFKRARLIAVIGMGSTPGTTNVDARLVVDQMDRVSEVHAICASPEPPSSGDDDTFDPSYSITTILDEFSMNPVVFKGGEFVELQPVQNAGFLILPEPIGKVQFYYTLHSEPATFPIVWRDKGIRESAFLFSMRPSFYKKARFLTNLGFAGSDPISVGNTSMTPRDFLTALLRSRPSTPKKSVPDSDLGFVVGAKVVGEKEGRAYECLVWTRVFPHEKWGLSSEEVGTGTPPSIVAQMIGKGEIREPGVHPPEVAVPVPRYQEELLKRGMPTYVLRSETIVASYQ